MADATIFGGRYVVSGFSDGGITVTRNTIIDYTCVIKLGARKCRGVMAQRTIFSGRNMGGIRLGILSGCTNSMASVAALIAGQVTVVKYCGFKTASGDMADITILTGLNMRAVQFVRFAYRNCAVVTGYARIVSHQRSAVINKCRIKKRCIMTSYTVCTGGTGNTMNKRIGFT